MTTLVTWLKQETRRLVLSTNSQNALDLEEQRFAEFGRVGASLLHDLSTPLTAATITLSNLQAEQSNRQLKRALADLKRIENYIQSARQQLGHAAIYRSFALNHVLRQACSILEVHATLNNVEIVTDLAEDVQLYGDPTKLQRAISNLIANAVESYDNSDIADKKVIVKTENTSNSVIVTIDDYGKGIKKLDKEHIFDPFYSTKQTARNSLGIGLVIVKTTIENDFGGRVYVKSRYLHGSRFSLLLPLVRKS